MFSYNKANRRTRQHENDGTVTAWTFDPTYQLLRELRTGGIDNVAFDVAYAYDAAGNRTSMSDGTATTAYTYSDANHLLEADAGPGEMTTYDHDAAGNRTLVQAPQGNTYYGYDAAGRCPSLCPLSVPHRFASDSRIVQWW
jgi:YD repeat-containing protein